MKTLNNELHLFTNELKSALIQSYSANERHSKENQPLFVSTWFIMLQNFIFTREHEVTTLTEENVDKKADKMI